MRTIIIITLVLLSLTLMAETIALPDVNVSVESPIKAFVYKKPLLTPQDSLRQNIAPRLLPTYDPEIHYASIMPYYPPVLVSLSGFITPLLEHELSLNYYPKSVPINAINLSFLRTFNDDDRYVFSTTSGVRGSFDKHDLSAEMIFHKANYHGDRNELFSLIFTHAADSLTDKGYTIHSPFSRFGVSHTTGNNGSFYLEHSNWFRLWNSRADFHYLTQSAAHLLDVDYQLPLNLPYVDNASFGFMSDFSNFIPYLQYQKRIVLAPGKTIFISNSPSSTNDLLYPLTNHTPYVSYSAKHQMTLSPFDQRFVYSMVPNNSWLPALKSINLSLNTGYTFNSAIPAYDPTASIPVMSYKDVFSGILNLGMNFKLKSLNIRQNADISLLHLPESHWRRVPYRGLVNLMTTFELSLPKLDLAVHLNQSYNRIDHDYRQLPDQFLLDFTVSYRFCRSLSLYGSINNLFDSDNTYWRGIPWGERDLRLGFRYMLKR